MPGLLPTVDPEGLLEFSVVYTDRALNHMSRNFQGVMKDISAILKDVYKAHATALVPGSGTFGMESVARQFANGKDVMVLRNGWFSFRWTQIFEMGNIPASSTVLKARKQGSGPSAPWVPGNRLKLNSKTADARSDAIRGGFQSAGVRPEITSRAALFGLERQLLETLGLSVS